MYSQCGGEDDSSGGFLPHRGAPGPRELRRSGASSTLTVAHNGGVAGLGMREAYFKPFTAKAGHQITTIRSTRNSPVLARRSRRRTWPATSSAVTAINEATACEEGLLEKIDWSTVLDPKDFADVGGFGGSCGLPNNFVSGGLTYDFARYPPDKAPKSWPYFGREEISRQTWPCSTAPNRRWKSR